MTTPDIWITNPSVQEWINGNSHIPTTELGQNGASVFIKTSHRWFYLGTNPTAPKQAAVTRKEAPHSKGVTTEHNVPTEKLSLKSFLTLTKRGISPPPVQKKKKNKIQEVFIMSLLFLVLSGTSHWSYRVWASCVSARFSSSKGFPALWNFSPVKYLNILATLRSKETISSTI